MINEMHFYEQLNEMPLFQGMSRDDFMFVIGAVKFEFYTVQAGKYISHEGDVCDSAVFLLEGDMMARRSADDKSYTVTEYLSAPRVIQIERLFGMTQFYDRDYIAETKCAFVKISKTEIMRIIDESFIFKLNMLNLLCTRVQRLGRIPWRTAPSNLRAKIVRFVHERCTYPAGKKDIGITMERLAQAIGESRINTSDELKRMKEESLIDLKRGAISIYALENMF